MSNGRDPESVRSGEGGRFLEGRIDRMSGRIEKLDGKVDDVAGTVNTMKGTVDTWKIVVPAAVVAAGVIGTLLGIILK